jgi:hypothetical protein
MVCEMDWCEERNENEKNEQERKFPLFNFSSPLPLALNTHFFHLSWMIKEKTLLFINANMGRTKLTQSNNNNNIDCEEFFCNKNNDNEREKDSSFYVLGMKEK